MKQIYSILALVGILSLVSCTKEIIFKGDMLDPKLVVNSIGNVDSVFVVQVALSKPIPGYESSFQYLPDATVKLYSDGKELETLQRISFDGYDPEMIKYLESSLVNGTYVGRKTIIESGRTYRIEVSHPKYPTATSEMTAPTKIPIERIDTVSTIYVDNYSGNMRKYKASIRFTDPANEENFYRLHISYIVGRNYTGNQGPVEGSEKETVWLESYYNTYNGIESDDPVFASEQDANDFLFGGDSRSDYTVFTDVFFDGKTYGLSVFLTDWIASHITTIDTTKGEFFQANFELYSLPKETYYYIMSVGKFDWYSDGLFTEPVQVYNNIENGLGIFGAVSLARYKFQVGEYPLDKYNYQGGSYSY